MRIWRKSVNNFENGLIMLPSSQNLAAILNMARNIQVGQHGLSLLNFMHSNGLTSHKTLGNYLVSMLTELGALENAHKVLKCVGYFNEWSCYSLIRSYIISRKPDLAFNVYYQLQDNSITPKSHTYVALLKACAQLKDLKRGTEIHKKVVITAVVNSDPFIGSALVDMYCKCGSLEKARDVLLNLCNSNVVSWNALLTAYAKCEQGEETLKCFEEMQLDSILPDAFTYVCVLKACGSLRDANYGQFIHTEIEKKGLTDGDIFVGTALVDMYAKACCITEAEEVFQKLPVHNVVLWNTLMEAHWKLGQYEKVLDCLLQLQLDGLSPDTVTFTCLLRSCAKMRDLNKAHKIHAQIEKMGFLQEEPSMGRLLVDMYGKCNCIDETQIMFNKISNKLSIAWEMLITAYVVNGHNKQALECHKQMMDDGISPNPITYMHILKACFRLRYIREGQEIHAELERKSLTKENHFICSALIDMYGKWGLTSWSKQLFNDCPSRDTVLWNALLTGYIEHGWFEETLKCLEEMQQKSVLPTAVTFICTLKACLCTGASNKGQEIHADIEKIGLLDHDLFVGSSLIEMYSKLGLLEEAQNVFDYLPVQNVVLWNTLIKGYLENGYGDIALQCLSYMQFEGFFPDAFTFASSLKACCEIGARGIGQQLHDNVSSGGFLERDLVIGNTLVDMYGKCGLLKKAEQLFLKLPVRDIVSWNALITGYAEYGYGDKALETYENMKLEGFSPNVITLLCGLKSCSNIRTIGKGYMVHSDIVKKGLQDRHLIGNVLIDLYAKSGFLSSAQDIFDKLEVRDAVSWNSLIAGYAHVGESENVFQNFHQMTREGTHPDRITFIAILNACSLRGLFNMSQTYFEIMSREYGILPTLQHHTCVVDLLGRVGQLDKALGMLNQIPESPNLAVWHMVLDACKKWGNFRVGRKAFESVMHLDKSDAAAYVLMSHIYEGYRVLENY